MRKSDNKKFSEIMTGLAELYGKDLSKFMLDIYFQALKDYDIESVGSAVSAHVRNPDNGQFYPKPADIVKLISGNSKDAGYLAWTKVERAVRRVGTYQTVVFDDAIIHQVVSDMGGWIMFGEKREDELPFVSKEFVERYQAYRSKQAPLSRYPQKLIGRTDAENGMNGYAAGTPVLIGNETEARKVMLGGAGKSHLQIEKLSKQDLVACVGR